MRHADAIHLCQNILGQIVFLIKPQMGRQSVAGALWRVEQAVEPAARGDTKEGALLDVRKGSIPVDVGAGRGHLAALEKALQFVFEADLLIGHGPSPDRLQGKPQSCRWSPARDLGQTIRSISQIPAE